MHHGDGLEKVVRSDPELLGVFPFLSVLEFLILREKAPVTGLSSLGLLQGSHVTVCATLCHPSVGRGRQMHGQSLHDQLADDPQCIEFFLSRNSCHNVNPNPSVRK